ncbi:MAG: hypothetical protein HC772_17390 [Leptolyngbyaceae cyanobacterium CRU_2_3]|nr:hypothetical protein [Leptolyngbyaceae cyanobacterium CRU_2_3]
MEGTPSIEFSYEGALDEQEIISALNLLWASSPNRHNRILSGTLRLPLSYHQPIAYLTSSR